MGGTSHNGTDSAGEGARLPRDRRASHRATIGIPALLRVGTRDVDCTLCDLSTQGVAVTVTESVAPGMVVRVVFRLPNARQPVDVAGVLVRSAGGRGDNTLGLQFVEPDADAVRAIEIFVQRNRSDQPFSRGRQRVAAGRRKGELGGSRDGLRKRAEKDVRGADRGWRRLLTRWLGRGKS